MNKNIALDKPKVAIQASLNNSNLISYGANTHNGIIRNYNEDRISIVLDLKNPTRQRSQPPINAHDKKVSFFAIFDGHGGQGCSEFLRDNLHNMIASSSYFPSHMDMAIREGCEVAESSFMERNKGGIVRDKSGSCAIIFILTDN